MPRYKSQERHSLLLPVELFEQIVPGSASVRWNRCLATSGTTSIWRG